MPMHDAVLSYEYFATVVFVAGAVLGTQYLGTSTVGRYGSMILAKVVARSA
jgi:hypothetical protein